MKLMIAIPTMETVPVEFMTSVTGLVRKLAADGVDFEVVVETGTLIYMARDRLAGKAVNGGYTDVLWLDSDMVFQPELVEDLQFCGKPFVSGLAQSRRAPYTSCLFKSIELDSLSRWTVEEFPTEAFRVAGCGFACVLISTDILKRVMLDNGTAFTPFKNYGEDLSFCKRAAALGVEIWAEPAVRVGHVGKIVVYPDDAGRWANAAK